MSFRGLPVSSSLPHLLLGLQEHAPGFLHVFQGLECKDLHACVVYLCSERD